jgi:uncharacterized membrane-anchored protein YjiN (DUF445 family)
MLINVISNIRSDKTVSNKERNDLISTALTDSKQRLSLYEYYSNISSDKEINKKDAVERKHLTNVLSNVIDSNITSKETKKKIMSNVISSIIGRESISKITSDIADNKTFTKTTQEKRLSDVLASVSTNVRDKKITDDTINIVTNTFGKTGVENVSRNIRDNIITNISGKKVFSDIITRIANDTTSTDTERTRQLTDIVTNSMVKNIYDTKTFDNVASLKTAKNSMSRVMNSKSANVVQNLISNVINTEVMKKAGKAIPKYESGGYVKNTGLALVHKDEYIVPKYYAPSQPTQIKSPTKEPTTNNYDYRTINIFDPNKMDLRREMRELGR